MSAASCFLLLLFCLSFHACNARRLAAAAEKIIEKKFPISNQNVDNVIAVSPTKEYSFSSKEDPSIAKRTQLDENTQELKDSKAKQKPLMDYEREKISGGVDHQKESLVSVSWPVPQKKRGEKHPGFNLDYSPPKTHPPSHN